MDFLLPFPITKSPCDNQKNLVSQVSSTKFSANSPIIFDWAVFLLRYAFQKCFFYIESLFSSSYSITSWATHSICRIKFNFTSQRNVLSTGNL